MEKSDKSQTGEAAFDPEGEEEIQLEGERKRAAQLAMVNEVGKIAMSTLDPDELMRRVAQAIQRNFEYYDVGLFLLDRGSGEVVLKGLAGAYTSIFPEGYRQEVGRGMIGWVAQSGEFLLANDVTKEPRHIFAFLEEQQSRSELSVPIKIGEEVIGVIDVQSTLLNAFDERDVASLQTISDQIARAVENAWLYRETALLKELNESIVVTIPSPLLLLDRELNIVTANRSYCERRSGDKEDIKGRDIRQVEPPDSPLLRPDVIELMSKVAETGESAALTNVMSASLTDPGRIFNIHITGVEAGGENRILVVLEDVTAAVEKAHELSMLHQIGEVMQEILDLDRLLHAILTCVTAGSALGFNRAILLLIDSERNVLEGKMGVGPASQEDAGRIWSRLAEENPTLKDFLDEYDRISNKEEMPLYNLAKRISLPLDGSSEIPVLTVLEKKAFKVTDALNDPRVGPKFLDILGANEFVCVPLIAKDRAVGAIIADNLYSGRPISDDDVQLLTVFANQAGLAIENAGIYKDLEDKVRELEEAYTKLEKAQDDLVRSERLAAMGEMSARVAHEIRNPLVTIGGFARSILKNPALERVERSTRIIVEEVERLERILADTLDFTRSAKPVLEPRDLNQILRDTYLPMTESFKDKRIALSERLSPELPHIRADAGQLKQVFLNVIWNALQAMPGGGELGIKTEVEDGSIVVEISDTGVGISPDNLDSVFNPFFTSKTYGTGLGLTVCRRIIEDHGGDVSIKSGANVGTTLTIRLPIEAPEGLEGGDRP